MKYLLNIAIAITLVSCNNENNNLEEKQQAYNDLKAETLEVHDAIMPKTSELMELNYELTTVLESGLDTITPGAASREQLLQTKDDVDNANDAMMEWMRDYSEKFPYGEDAPSEMSVLDEKMQMLQEEFDEINNVNKLTDKAIARAREEMKAFPQIQAKGEVEPAHGHQHDGDSNHDHNH